MTNEQTTVNIAKALRVCFEKTCACSECPFEHESCGDLEQLAADRLEQQEQRIAELEREIAGDRTEIIMLLRLGWLETQDRYPFWCAHPNVSLITLRDRPKFVGNGTDFAAYGWFIWSNRQQFVMPCVAAQAGEGGQDG